MKAQEINAKRNEIKEDKRLLPEEKIYLQNLLQRIYKQNV